MEFFIGVGASLVASIISFGFGYFFKSHQYTVKYNAAPRVYLEHLEKLISQSIEEGKEHAVSNARVIVAARDRLRFSLVSMSSHLNSEIDSLSRLLNTPFDNLQSLREMENEGTIKTSDTYSQDVNNKSERKDYSFPPNFEERTFKTIEELWKGWPTRKSLLEVEIRKLLVELGLVER